MILILTREAHWMVDACGTSIHDTTTIQASAVWHCSGGRCFAASVRLSLLVNVRRTRATATTDRRSKNVHQMCGVCVGCLLLLRTLNHAPQLSHPLRVRESHTKYRKDIFWPFCQRVFSCLSYSEGTFFSLTSNCCSAAAAGCCLFLLSVELSIFCTWNSCPQNTDKLPSFAEGLGRITLRIMALFLGLCQSYSIYSGCL